MNQRPMFKGWKVFIFRRNGCSTSAEYAIGNFSVIAMSEVQCAYTLKVIRR